MAETIEYAPRSRARLSLIIIAVLTLALLIGVLAWKKGWLPAAPDTQSRLAALEHKTQELSQEVTALSARVDSQHTVAAASPEAIPAASETADAVDTFTPRIKALEDKLTTLTSQQNGLTQSLVETGNVRGNVAELDNKLHAIETTIHSSEARTRNLVTRLNAFYRLNDAVRAGRAYTNELAQMQEFAADHQAIRNQLQKLEPFADTGIPTPWQLRTEFAAAVRAALAPKPAANASFRNKLVANLKQLIVVRKVGASEDAPGPKAAIARAEADIDQLEIEAALAEVTDLPEPYRSAFVDWADMAQFYINVPEALLAVQNQGLI